MILLSRSKLVIGLDKLNRRLLDTGSGKTQMIDKLRQFSLIVGRMKSTVERQTLHTVLKVILQSLRFTDCHLFVAFIAFHQNSAHNEASRIFEYGRTKTVVSEEGTEQITRSFVLLF